MKKSWILILGAIPLVAIASVVVWKASGDDSRRQGALGSDEAVALSWRGDWSAETEYAQGNVVSHEGTSYVADGEKPEIPRANCEGCGWTVVGVERAPAQGLTEVAKEIGGYEIIEKVVSIPPGRSYQHIKCSSPEKSPLGAGWREPAGRGAWEIGSGQPFDNQSVNYTGTPEVASGWAFTVYNDLNGDRDITLYLTCAPLPH